MHLPARLLAATALVAGAALLCAPASRAQGRADDPDTWRREVDRLLDRWADGVGGNRLQRARELTWRRVEAAPEDSMALVELARLDLALGRADKALEHVEKALFQFGADEEKERKRLLDVNAEREKNQLPPIEPAPELVERRSQALALAYLAGTENALTVARSLEGEAARTALQEKQAELSRRRQALSALAGEERGAMLLRQESSRRLFLRTLDRLGQEPRPLGATDAAGQAIDLMTYRGKLLLIVFWSHALGGGEEVLLEIEAVREEHEKALEVLGVCLDAPGGPASQWLTEHGIAWRQVFTEKGLLSDDARACGIL